MKRKRGSSEAGTRPPGTQALVCCFSATFLWSTVEMRRLIDPQHGDLIRVDDKRSGARLIAGIEEAMMRIRLWTVVFSVAFATVAVMSYDVAGQTARPTRAPTTSFKEDVLPIFKGRCVECHAPGGKGFEASGLDLQSYAGLMKGTKFGPMVIPGDAQASSLMAMLDWRVAEQIRMPHGSKKLSICDRDAIRHWIDEGAQDN